MELDDYQGVKSTPLWIWQYFGGLLPLQIPPSVQLWPICTADHCILRWTRGSESPWVLCQKHKLGCLFFFLNNVRPQYQATLKSIHLLAVKRWINVFLSPFVYDLKTPYCDGIVASVGGESRTFHGALLVFLADTLVVHMVGGFKGSMSFALRICRTCMITSEQLPEHFIESSCTLRTSNSYFEICGLLVGPLKAHYSTVYGINYMSILEEVPGYSVIHGLLHDIMHDLYEGIVLFEMNLVFCYCINHKYLTIEAELKGMVLKTINLLCWIQTYLVMLT